MIDQYDYIAGTRGKVNALHCFTCLHLIAPDAIQVGMDIRICFTPVAIGGGKEAPKSTYEIYDIDDRILKDYRSYLATGAPVGGAYGEDENDYWLHIDFRTVAFMIPIAANSRAPSMLPPGLGDGGPVNLENLFPPPGLGG